MDDHSLEVLEFPRIREWVAACADTDLGRERAQELRPSPTLEEAQAAQALTREAVRLLELRPRVSLAGCRDVRPAVRRALAGGILTPAELAAVRDTLVSLRRFRRLVLDGQEHWPLLAGLVARSEGVPPLEDYLSRTLTADGEVADGATPLLARLRAELAQLQARMRERLEEMIRSPETARYLQEPLITVRAGRYVLPVKQEHRAQVPGLVHDASQTGATLFIEPLTVLELGNRVRETESRVEEEIGRILREASAKVAEAGEVLSRNLQVVAEADAVLARARLAREMGGVAPRLSAGRGIRLVGARHPLLGTRAVPLDVEVGYGFSVLVVTGPNTGGKTVALKTVGLLALMAQAGLYVPAEEGTEVGVKARILADVGDEQSVAQNLSTFSSHMRHIVSILRQADSRTLVLLDEIGAGTDPQEGAALATAVLETLLERGALVVATTHFSALKTFAYQHPGVENASVTFDEETLAPTYRLVLGTPGKSHAFLIAQRLGLEEEVLARAQEHLHPDKVRLEDILSGLEAARRAAEEDRRQAMLERRRAEELERRWAEAVEEIGRRQQEIVARARREAEELVRGARREVEEALRQVRQARRREDAEEMLRKAREALVRARAQVDRHAPPAEWRGPAPEVKPGDWVRIVTLGHEGRVVRGPDEEDRVQVEVGIARLTVPRRDLRVVTPSGAPAPPSSVGTLLLTKAKEVRPEVDLRGLTVDEALDKVDKYLDDAVLAGLTHVRIVHGKGSGTLRQAVGSFLASHPHVHAWRLGGPGEGGDGVTVAELGRS